MKSVQSAVTHKIFLSQSNYESSLNRILMARFPHQLSPHFAQRKGATVIAAI